MQTAATAQTYDGSSSVVVVVVHSQQQHSLPIYDVLVRSRICSQQLQVMTMTIDRGSSVEQLSSQRIKEITAGSSRRSPSVLQCLRKSRLVTCRRYHPRSTHVACDRSLCVRESSTTQKKALNRCYPIGTAELVKERVPVVLVVGGLEAETMGRRRE